MPANPNPPAPATPPSPRHSPPLPGPPPNNAGRAIKARFLVIARQVGGGVRMQPVQATDPDHPNYKFWQATPSGNIELYIQNEAAADAFELGKEYDVTFTPRS